LTFSITKHANENRVKQWANLKSRKNCLSRIFLNQEETSYLFSKHGCFKNILLTLPLCYSGQSVLIAKD